MRLTICARSTGCEVSLITNQSTPLCGMCQHLTPPAPPPMRAPRPTSIIPSVGSMLVVLVFIAGMAVGAKMAGGW
jgi:hypothetical protein